MSAGRIVMETPIHTLKVVASFALLGAAIAGVCEMLPVVGALAAIIDLHAVGAIIGGVAGAATQAVRN